MLAIFPSPAPPTVRFPIQILLSSYFRKEDDVIGYEENNMGYHVSFLGTVISCRLHGNDNKKGQVAAFVKAPTSTFTIW
jgi:hypothetical protein